MWLKILLSSLITSTATAFYTSVCPEGGTPVCATNGQIYFRFENNCKFVAHIFRKPFTGEPALVRTDFEKCLEDRSQDAKLTFNSVQEPDYGRYPEPEPLSIGAQLSGNGAQGKDYFIQDSAYATDYSISDKIPHANFKFHASQEGDGSYGLIESYNTETIDNTGLVSDVEPYAAVNPKANDAKNDILNYSEPPNDERLVEDYSSKELDHIETELESNYAETYTDQQDNPASKLVPNTSSYSAEEVQNMLSYHEPEEVGISKGSEYPIQKLEYAENYQKADPYLSQYENLQQEPIKSFYPEEVPLLASSALQHPNFTPEKISFPTKEPNYVAQSLFQSPQQMNYAEKDYAQNYFKETNRALSFSEANERLQPFISSYNTKDLTPHPAQGQENTPQRSHYSERELDLNSLDPFIDQHQTILSQVQAAPSPFSAEGAESRSLHLEEKRTPVSNLALGPVYDSQDPNHSSQYLNDVEKDKAPLPLSSTDYYLAKEVIASHSETNEKLDPALFLSSNSAYDQDKTPLGSDYAERELNRNSVHLALDRHQNLPSAVVALPSSLPAEEADSKLSPPSAKQTLVSEYTLQQYENPTEPLLDRDHGADYVSKDPHHFSEQPNDTGRVQVPLPLLSTDYYLAKEVIASHSETNETLNPVLFLSSNSANGQDKTPLESDFAEGELNLNSVDFALDLHQTKLPAPAPSSFLVEETKSALSYQTNHDNSQVSISPSTESEIYSLREALDPELLESSPAKGSDYGNQAPEYAEKIQNPNYANSYSDHSYTSDEINSLRPYSAADEVLVPALSSYAPEPALLASSGNDKIPSVLHYAKNELGNNSIRIEETTNKLSYPETEESMIHTSYIEEENISPSRVASERTSALASHKDEQEHEDKKFGLTHTENYALYQPELTTHTNQNKRYLEESSNEKMCEKSYTTVNQYPEQSQPHEVQTRMPPITYNNPHQTESYVGEVEEYVDRSTVRTTSEQNTEYNTKQGIAAPSQLASPFAAEEEDYSEKAKFFAAPFPTTQNAISILLPFHHSGQVETHVQLPVLKITKEHTDPAVKSTLSSQNLKGLETPSPIFNAYTLSPTYPANSPVPYQSSDLYSNRSPVYTADQVYPSVVANSPVYSAHYKGSVFDIFSKLAIRDLSKLLRNWKWPYGPIYYQPRFVHVIYNSD